MFLLFILFGIYILFRTICLYSLYFHMMQVYCAVISDYFGVPYKIHKHISFLYHITFHGINGDVTLLTSPYMSLYE